jgi:hypothetical protein
MSQSTSLNITALLSLDCFRLCFRGQPRIILERCMEHGSNKRCEWLGSFGPTARTGARGTSHIPATLQRNACQPEYGNLSVVAILHGYTDSQARLLMPHLRGWTPPRPPATPRSPNRPHTEKCDSGDAAWGVFSSVYVYSPSGTPASCGKSPKLDYIFSSQMFEVISNVEQNSRTVQSTQGAISYQVCCGAARAPCGDRAW